MSFAAINSGRGSRCGTRNLAYVAAYPPHLPLAWSSGTHVTDPCWCLHIGCEADVARDCTADLAALLAVYGTSRSQQWVNIIKRGRTPRDNALRGSLRSCRGSICHERQSKIMATSTATWNSPARRRYHGYPET